jgi:hypothetical protein
MIDNENNNYVNLLAFDFTCRCGRVLDARAVQKLARLRKHTWQLHLPLRHGLSRPPVSVQRQRLQRTSLLERSHLH